MSSTLEATNKVLKQDSLAEFIVEQWDEKKGNRSTWEEEKRELRNYLFATDTTTTTAGNVGWRNSTTIPKICQIRDNLHANYISALFPNDNWLRWEGYGLGDEAKRAAIQAYMENKTREGNFREVVSSLLLDYIDYGVAFGDVVWANEQKEDPETKETIPGYVGPRATRTSPLDHIFDVSSSSYERTWKITRTVKTFGQLKLDYKDTGDEYIKKAIARAESTRVHLSSHTADDFEKAGAFSVDGFGDYYTYLGSGYIELLEFEGTLHDPNTNKLYDDYVITVIDRTTVLRAEGIPAWKRGGHRVMSSWRKRPDNLMGMGPLDNLVGMQYRLDHAQNAAADARDLTIMPPLKVKGELQEATSWGPFARFQLEDDGDIQPLFTGTNIPAMEGEIAFLMAMMEEMAGAPKQAMGIRTPGEKTALEVQTLENAAGRIFQEKVTQFELEVLEPLLNNMLEVAVRNMQSSDVVRVLDDDLGVAEFMTISKEDITAKGKLRPVGARHFAAQAQLMQNITSIANSNIWPKIEPHVGGKDLAKLVEDVLQLSKFDLVRDNAGILDQMESQRLVQQGQETLAVEAATPIEE